MSSHRKAFTLIELLVVISIIALLIAILMPALGAARKRAESVQCMSLQRQIGLAIFAYASDHNGYYWNNVHSAASAGHFWNQKLVVFGYMNGYHEMICPSFYVPPPSGNSRWYTFGMRGVSATREISLDTFLTPSTRWMIGDTVDNNNNAQTYRVMSSLGANTSYGGLHLRHANESTNILLGDGHVETAPRDRLKVFGISRAYQADPFQYVTF